MLALLYGNGGSSRSVRSGVFGFRFPTTLSIERLRVAVVCMCAGGGSRVARCGSPSEVKEGPLAT